MHAGMSMLTPPLRWFHLPCATVDTLVSLEASPYPRSPTRSRRNASADPERMHADPEGSTLIMLADAIEALQAKRASGAWGYDQFPHEFGIFWEYEWGAAQTRPTPAPSASYTMSVAPSHDSH